jgi:choline dehydrogenase-like flavoprotein
MIYIVGSGLTGIAAAAGLVKRGYRPTILDVGLTPEECTLQLKSRLATADPGTWEERDLRLAKRLGPVALNGIPRKLYCGSDFSFQQVDLASPLQVRQASVHRSFAAGGFSNVWGSVIEPMPSREMSGWPISFNELAPHYIHVRKLVCDPPNDAVELQPAAFGRLRPSTQARAFYADLRTARKELADSGIRFSYPQMAIRVEDKNGDRGCCYCGLCLHGCPYDAKYAAGVTLRQFVREGSITYIPGIIVDRVAQEDGHIRISARSATDGSPVAFRGERVIIAAGFLESSRIVLNSLRLYGVPFQVKHSDIFTLPIIRYSATPGIVHESLHTLCQLVAQIDDFKMSPHPVHLQFYGYNDLYAGILRDKIGFAIPFNRVVNALATRLFVIFGYLHSSVSSTLTLTLTSSHNPGLRLEGQPSGDASKISRSVAQKLFQNRRYLRAIPVPGQIRLDLPGGGYHSGGIFPMSDHPKDFETDRLGTIRSLPGVHIVDTSILPEIPPFPTAFTAMANAHRIASEL